MFALKNTLQKLLCVFLPPARVEKVRQKAGDHGVAAWKELFCCWRAHGRDKRDGNSFLVRGRSQRRRLFGGHARNGTAVGQSSVRKRVSAALKTSKRESRTAAGPKRAVNEALRKQDAPKL